MPNQTWDIATQNLANELGALPHHVPGGRCAEIPQSLRDALAVADKWDNDRKVITFGQLPAEKLVPLCREGLLPWWVPMTGAAVLGDASSLQLLNDAMDADAGKGNKPNYSSMLTWLCMQDSFEQQRYPVKTTPEVLRLVFSWGADPNHQEGKWLGFAAERLSTECLGLFLDNAASATVILHVMDRLVSGNKSAQLNQLREALKGRSLYAKIDDDTLIEVKYVADSAKGSTLRRIFNFGAARVQEIYEPIGGSPAMASIGFDGYAPRMLERAAEQLIKLGGNPAPQLDKPVHFPKLSKPAAN